MCASYGIKCIYIIMCKYGTTITLYNHIKDVCMTKIIIIFEMIKMVFPRLIAFIKSISVFT